MTMNANGTLTEGPIGGTLIRLATPMVAGIVAIMLFGVIDTLYVGHLGVTELAAMSFTFPGTYLVMKLPTGSLGDFRDFTDLLRSLRFLLFGKQRKCRDGKMIGR